MAKEANVGIEKVRKDYSISFVRLIAMCFIVTCHIMQRDSFATDIYGAHIEWAFWLNIGVQMFLCISGYLYGLKKKIVIVDFYKKRFFRILVDYYVFIFAMIVFISCSPVMNIDVNDIKALISFSGTIAGLEHLWFIPTILFCYSLTPIFSDVINSIDRRGDLGFVLESILLLIVIHEIITHFFEYFSPAWTNCFVIGMLYARFEKRDTIKTLFYLVITVLCLIIIPIQFRIDYWPHKELPAFLVSRYAGFVAYGHAFLGIAAVICIRFLYCKYNSQHQQHLVLDWSDKYSYDVYLVHHVFVQSAFGCVELIPNRWIAIPLAIACTIIASVILNIVSNIIRNICITIFKRLLN